MLPCQSSSADCVVVPPKDPAMHSTPKPSRRPHWRLSRIFFSLAAAASLAPAMAGAQTTAGIPPGDARQTVTVGGVALSVSTYRPAGCAPRAVLVVFHGIGRNPDAYRDHAKPLADAACAAIVAPLFDRARFPERAYQYGGMVEHGSVTPAGSRTVDLVPPLARWAQLAAGGASLPIILLGHSAGAQFLDRVAAFAPTGATRILLANPSTWVLPDSAAKLPFGFGGLGAPAQDEAAIRAYLALPITVLLGTADLKSRDLTMTAEAMAQGPDRYHRGLNTFSAAQAEARSKGWRFGWVLSEVPNIGHNATAMFASRQAQDALAAALAGPPPAR